MPMYRQEFALSPLQVSMLLAMPVLVGSLGRIMLGALTDRYGGRRMFAVICLITALPTAALSFVAHLSLLWPVIFVLGLAGASFAVGVPYINAWFDRRERGLALGVYGVGNAGTAAAGLLTPRLVLMTNRTTVFLALAALLVLAGVAMARWGRDAPGWRPNRVSPAKGLLAALRWHPVWPLSMLYAVTFGAFIAFGLYLPIVLTTRYDLSMVDAAARAAGFVLLATLARPVGGWLSDRLGALPVLRLVFTVAALLVLGIASEPTLMPIGTVLYLTLAVMLGMGNGAVFAYIGHGCPEKLVGTASGVVGMMGGLGGFFPPLLMGASLQLTDSYAPALLLLVFISATIAVNMRRLMPATQGYK